MKRKIGLFAGGIEQYWKDAGMKELPQRLGEDARRLATALGREFEVIYPGLAGNPSDARKIGKTLRNEEVDLALMYHATYVDDAMTVAFLSEIGDIYPVLFQSQGFKSFLEPMDLTDLGRSWGNNSSVQLPGTVKRLKPDLKFGYVFGELENPRALKEIKEYGRAARAVKSLKGKRVGFLPHRSLGVPMYDTYPDETKMIGQTGIEIDYLHIIQLVKEMEAVDDRDCKRLVDELYEKYEVVEPPKEEVDLTARQALALERLVEKNDIDALAVDFSAGMIPLTGAMPCVGMARLIDKGIVVTTEGDLSVSVAGLIIKDITGKPIHFWEHLAFDEENNWILGGHEGGSAGFTMAKEGTRPKLRCNQYINWEGIPGAPHYGVVPEFITNPGPVTLLTFYRGPEAYEMRLASGESVDLDPLPVHYEHTVFKPCVDLNSYFRRIAEVGVCHHFALVNAEIKGDLEKVAEIMGMRVQCLTQLQGPD
jgi:L-arabinose isomerase